MRVAVVGGGVIGLTSAIAVKAAFPEFEVNIFAEELSPNTTGDGSAGLWGPYLLGDTPAKEIAKWAGRTHRWFEELWKAGFASETGISLIPAYRLTKYGEENLATEAWVDLVYGARRLGKDELQRMSREHNLGEQSYNAGWQFVTYTSEPIRLLPWLANKFLASGGKILMRKISSLEELFREGYDLIINSTGLGARELVDDVTVTPIRGQVSRVNASWAMHAYLVDDDDGNYIIPNIDSVVLGGTHQEGDFDRVVRQNDSKFIHDGCNRMLPGLKTAEIIEKWVGLRPGRSQVRLESETLQSSHGEKCMVIHNYGHGGSGVTLCWGCALDVVDLVKNRVKIQLESKL